MNVQAIDLLNNQLKAFMELIEEFSNMYSKIKIILEIEIIADSIVFTYTSDINGFDSIVKLRTYTGISPITKQSSVCSISSHKAKSGNKLMSYALYLSALSAIKYNSIIKRYQSCL